MTIDIRIADAADSDAIAAVYRPYVEDSRISFEDRAPEGDDMALRIVGDGRSLYPWLVAQENKRILGYAATSPFRTRSAYRWCVETGIYLLPDACGRGIGRTLLEQLLDLLNRQGFVSAIGAIALPNDASVKLHEALGFAHSGTYRKVGFKLGEWIDVGLWQKDLAPRLSSPAEPVPFTAIFSAA